MALKWSISHEDRLVVVQVTDKLRTDEVRGAYAAVIADGALPYRKLIDLRYAPLELGASAIAGLGTIGTEVTKDMPLGPVAFLINRELATDMVELFSRKMRQDRPLAVFQDTEAAMWWLDKIAPPRR